MYVHVRAATCLLVGLALLGASGRAAATGGRSPMTVVSIKDMAPGEAPTDAPPVAKPAPRRKASPSSSASPKKPGPRSTRSAPKAPPAVELVALNTHESFTLRPTPSGGFARLTMRSLARFLRCHHTQRLHAISERLARLLYDTASHFHARLEVIAGYRAPRIARQKGNTKSPHKRGVACDFRIAGIANEIVRDFVRSFPRVGVGFYPNSGFVHLDVRDKQSAFWVDYSAPGERAVYSKTPEDDVRRLAEQADGRADSDVDQPEGQGDPAEQGEGASVGPSEGHGPQVGGGPGVAPPNRPAASQANTQKD